MASPFQDSSFLTSSTEDELGSRSPSLSPAGNTPSPRVRCKFLNCNLDYARNSERNRHYKKNHANRQTCIVVGCDVLLPPGGDAEHLAEHLAEHQRIQDGILNISRAATMLGSSVLLYPNLSRSNDSSTSFCTADQIQFPLLTTDNLEAMPLTSANMPLPSKSHFIGTETMAGNFSNLNNPTELASFPYIWPHSGRPANPDSGLLSQASGDMQHSTHFVDSPVEDSQDYTHVLLPFMQGVEENHTLSNNSRAPAHTVLNESLYMTLLESSDVDWDPSE